MAFCTNCKNEIHEQAVVCPKCAVPSRVEKKFCFHCGETLANPNQIYCLTCGCPTATSSRANKSKVAAGFLAFFLGGFGAHKFYHGSWGWGIIYLIAYLMCLVFVASGIGITPVALIPSISFGILLLVEALMYWCGNKDKYDAKYNQRPSHPFKW